MLVIKIKIGKKKSKKIKEEIEKPWTNKRLRLLGFLASGIAFGMILIIKEVANNLGAVEILTEVIRYTTHAW